MKRSKIADYLEEHLTSHPEHIMDNGTRLVWIDEVIDAVDHLINDTEEYDMSPEEITNF